MKGKFTFTTGDGVEHVWYNHIMDEGIKKMLMAISNPNSDNNLLLWISVGTSDVRSDDTDLTELENEVGVKYDIGSNSVNNVYPFDLELSVIIPAGSILAGTVIKELGIWWGSRNSKRLFARATDTTGITVITGNDTVISYSLTVV